MQISYFMTMCNNHYCVSSEHKCDKSCYIYYILLSFRSLLSACLPEQDALCDHLFYFSLFLHFQGFLQTAGLLLVWELGVLWPQPWLRFLPHGWEWHDIYQSCRAVIHFFFFLKWHCWSIHGLKDPHWAPLGHLHASLLSPFRWGLVITGMEARSGLIRTRCKVLRQRTLLSFLLECASFYPLITDKMFVRVAPIYRTHCDLLFWKDQVS